MEAIIYFTNISSLDQVGVHPDWNPEVDNVIFREVDNEHEIWLIYDLIRITDLKALVEYKKPSALYWVYHTLPEYAFIRAFKKFLEQQKIYSESLQESAMYTENSVYEKLNDFQTLDICGFLELRQRIRKLENLISNMIRLLSNRKKFLISPPDIRFYPAELQEAFLIHTSGINEKNFDLKKNALRDELNGILLTHNNAKK